MAVSGIFACRLAIGAGLTLAAMASMALPGHAATEKVLYAFAGGDDGRNPESDLVNINGLLYGTASSGAFSDCGTIFTITPAGSMSTFYNFTANGPSDGCGPRSSLTNVGGTLYGTTSVGGSTAEGGTLYSITPQGSESVLYPFQGGSDGQFPIGDLLNVGGTLYGVTYAGGSAKSGTLFSYATNNGPLTTLHSFGTGFDGASPEGNLISVGALIYGITTRGAPTAAAPFTRSPILALRKCFIRSRLGKTEAHRKLALSIWGACFTGRPSMAAPGSAFPAAMWVAARSFH